MNEKIHNFVAYIGFVLALLSFGGMIFLFLEKGKEAKLKTKIDEELQMCENLSPEEGMERDGCFWYLALKRIDPQLCFRISGQGEYYYSDCILEIAVKKQDSNLCEYLSPSQRDSCVEDLALRLGKSEFCERLSDEFSKNSCYFNVATEKKDTKICDKMTNFSEPNYSRLPYAVEYTREGCYARVATYLNRPEICDQLTAPANPDLCYYSFVANNRQQKNLCERIRDSEIKKKCREL